MKKLALLLIAAAAFASTQASAAITKIRIASEGAYAPFNYVDPNGKLGGFDIEIANALCEHMKVECELVAQDWDGMIPGLLAKKYDAIVAQMAITDERKQKVDFTDKYTNTPAQLVAKKGANIPIGADGFVDPKALAGKKIGVQRATIHEKFANTMFPGAEVVVYDTSDNANLDLAAERVDLRLDDSVALSEFLKTDQGKDFEPVGKGYVEPHEILGYGAGIAVRKEDTELKEMLNKALAEIRADGTYKKINDKYFTFDAYGQ